MEPTNKKIENIMKRYLELPADVQNALFAKKTSDTILEVGKKHSITIEKIGELADETGLVMLGITPPGEYIKNLVRRLDVEQEKARAIAEDINQKVFSPVRESLKKIHGLQPEAGNVKPETSSPKPKTQNQEPQPVPEVPKQKIEAKELKPIEVPIPKMETPKQEIRTMHGDLKKTVAPPEPEAEQELPSIFIKKVPTIEPAPVPSVPPTSSSLNDPPGDLRRDLERELNGSAKPPTNRPKNADPYREPIE